MIIILAYATTHIYSRVTWTVISSLESRKYSTTFRIGMDMLTSPEVHAAPLSNLTLITVDYTPLKNYKSKLLSHGDKYEIY